MRRVAGAVLLLLAAVPAGAVVERIETDGSCIQAALAFGVASSNVRPFVPEEFPLLEVAGNASVFVYTVDCSVFRVDGASQGRNLITGVAAFVRPRDGSPGVEAYDILMTTSHEAFYTGVTNLGLFHGFITPAVTFGPGPVSKVEADTPWSYSPYSYELNAIAPPPAGITFPSTHWQLGNRGLVRTNYTHTSFVLTPGAGTLTAAPESPLARILGATSANGAGGILQFSFTGVTELVESDEPTDVVVQPRVEGRRTGRPLPETGVASTAPAGIAVIASAALAGRLALARRNMS